MSGLLGPLLLLLFELLGVVSIEQTQLSFSDLTAVELNAQRLETRASFRP